MIPVKKAPKPKSFDERVRKPGFRAIAEMIGKQPRQPRRAGRRHEKIADRAADIPAEKLPDYWVEVLDDLMEAYQEICAFSCFRIHRVTGARSVDHFAAKSKSWRRAYQWSNYRLCCSLLNSRKTDLADVLDPFKIQAGWFQLELDFFQVVPSPNLSAEIKALVEATIERLGLNDPQLRSRRDEDARTYWSGDCSFKILKKESPFVAIELLRQNRIDVRDRDLSV